MNGRCHQCGAELVVADRVGHRDRCDGCGSDLHCCRNCHFFEPGYHNDCREPQAERQVEKEKRNYCDYFRLKGAVGRVSKEPAAAAARAELDGLFRRGGR